MLWEEVRTSVGLIPPFLVEERMQALALQLESQYKLGFVL